MNEIDVTASLKSMGRLIDTREKMNLAFRTPVRPFFEILRDLAMNGDIVIFQDDAGKPDYKAPMNAEQVENAFYKTDTSVVIDYDTYEESVSITKSELYFEDINRYRVKEIWFFDEESSTLQVRILGIAPLIDVKDENGNFRYEQLHSRHATSVANNERTVTV